MFYVKHFKHKNLNFYLLQLLVFFFLFFPGREHHELHAAVWECDIKDQDVLSYFPLSTQKPHTHPCTANSTQKHNSLAHNVGNVTIQGLHICSYFSPPPWAVSCNCFWIKRTATHRSSLGKIPHLSSVFLCPKWRSRRASCALIVRQNELMRNKEAYCAMILSTQVY